MEASQSYWATAQAYLSDALDFAHQGFLEVNGVLGLVIALIAAFLIGRYTLKAVVTTTIGATIVFMLAQLAVPVIRNSAAFKLPDVMVATFWRQMGLLAVGLFIVITIFYVLKKTVLRGHH
jgi:hypothetical protein